MSFLRFIRIALFNDLNLLIPLHSNFTKTIERLYFDNSSAVCKHRHFVNAGIIRSYPRLLHRHLTNHIVGFSTTWSKETQPAKHWKYFAIDFLRPFQSVLLFSYFCMNWGWISICIGQQMDLAPYFLGLRLVAALSRLTSFSFSFSIFLYSDIIFLPAKNVRL